jgi:hypothetical protein
MLEEELWMLYRHRETFMQLANCWKKSKICRLFILFY